MTGLCPSWVKNGSVRARAARPLYPQARTSGCAIAKSALPPSTDMRRLLRYVRFVPTTELTVAARSINSLVRRDGNSRSKPGCVTLEVLLCAGRRYKPEAIERVFGNRAQPQGAGLPSS